MDKRQVRKNKALTEISINFESDLESARDEEAQKKIITEEIQKLCQTNDYVTSVNHVQSVICNSKFSDEIKEKLISLFLSLVLVLSFTTGCANDKTWVLPDNDTCVVLKGENENENVTIRLTSAEYEALREFTGDKKYEFCDDYEKVLLSDSEERKVLLTVNSRNLSDTYSESDTFKEISEVTLRSEEMSDEEMLEAVTEIVNNFRNEYKLNKDYSYFAVALNFDKLIDGYNPESYMTDYMELGNSRLNINFSELIIKKNPLSNDYFKELFDAQSKEQIKEFVKTYIVHGEYRTEPTCCETKSAQWLLLQYSGLKLTRFGLTQDEKSLSDEYNEEKITWESFLLNSANCEKLGK